ncbi:MAG: hypothetical protein GX660_07490 [Clostridiaceae bacterium]|nr:hypothetical protein [Clostridiaceae bacterium]
MLSLEEAKKTLNDPNLTDEEVLEIRDSFQALAEIIFEQWQLERRKERMESLEKNNRN